MTNEYTDAIVSQLSYFLAISLHLQIRWLLKRNALCMYVDLRNPIIIIISR